MTHTAVNSLLAGFNRARARLWLYEVPRHDTINCWLSYKPVAALIIFCSISWLGTAKVRAQEPPAVDSAVNAATLASGWWLPQQAQSTTVPHLVLSDAAPLNTPSAEFAAPSSFLYPLQMKYLSWEQSLVDTKSLTDERGLLLYPLVEFNFPPETLPIVLYVPPLRGSDAR